MAIQSFAGSGSERLFRTGRVPERAGWASVRRIATRKLDMLDYAEELGDLASPPGNRLEALKGDLRGLTASASTISGGWCSDGPPSVPPRWTSATTTERHR